MTTLRRIVTEAAKFKATDIHLNPANKPMIRVDGHLIAMEEEEILATEVISDIVEGLLDEKQRQLLQDNRDVQLTYIFDNLIRARISVYYQKDMPAIAIRLLRLKPPTLSELGAPVVLEKIAEVENGLLIIGGDFGSGRTTLAVAVLEQINKTRAAHILTLEKPVEYVLSSDKSLVDQREIGKDVTSMAHGLEVAKQEDVDVLFISQLTDDTIIKEVLELANVGVLCIVVMDVGSPTAAFDSLLSVFDPEQQVAMRALLSECYLGTVIQRLVPKIGGGVQPVHEVLLINESVKALIATARWSQLGMIIKSGRAEGMISLDGELTNLVHNQEVSFNDALSAAIDKEAFSIQSQDVTN